MKKKLRNRFAKPFCVAAILAGLCFGMSACSGETDKLPADNALSGIDSDLEAIREVYGAPGLAVSIVQDGELIYAGGFGFRDVSMALKVDENTVFPTASVTKQFTAALIGIHTADDHLAVSERPVHYLPNLRFKTEEMNRLVTISDLLSHNSGIGTVDGTHVFFPTDDREKHLARLQYLAPNSDVREKFDYSNMGYAVLAGIIEKISGHSWETDIEARIFKPLNMTRSSTSLSELLTYDNVAIGYGMIKGKPYPVLYEDQHEAGPSGAINSTALDLSNWMKMLLNEGAAQGGQIVPVTFIDDAFSAHTFINPTYSSRTKNLRLDAYGYGWFVSEFEGRYRVEHGGNTSGFTARVDMLPSENLGIAILTNQGSSELPRYVADIIYRRILGLSPKSIDEYPVRITDAAAFSELGPAQKASEPKGNLENYVGRYSNQGYGSFDVSLRGARLYISFPAFSFILKHQDGDNYVMQRYYEIHQNSPSFPLVFQSDDSGNLISAAIPFQSEPVIFTRN